MNRCYILLLVVMISHYAIAQDSLVIDDYGNVMINISDRNGNVKQVNIQDYLVPVGTIEAFAGDQDTVPSGWLICDGRRITAESNDSEYYFLVNLLRTIAKGDSRHPYIDGCNTNQANLPDLRGRFLRGMDDSSTDEGDANRDPDEVTERVGDDGVPLGRTNESGVVIDGVAGSVQEDAMQQITGYWASGCVRTYQGIEDGGALSYENYGRDGGYGGGYGTKIIFDSAKSENAHTSSETRPDNVYVSFMIKF